MKGKATIVAIARLFTAAVLALILVPMQQPRAATFPNGPIKWIIPYPSGGAYDAMSRGLAPILRKNFGVPVLVNIIPGPDGYNQLLRAKPDGQTIGMSEPLSAFTTSMLTNPNYDINKLVWLGRIDAGLSVVVASKKSGITSFQQLVSHKGPVRGGAFGVTTPIIQEILLANAAKFQLVPVNFRTIGELIFGTLRGDVDISILGVQPWLKHIQAGNVVPILIWDDKRDPRFPNVPCLADIGHTELDIFLNHRGLVAPPGISDATANQITDVFKKTVSGGAGKAFLEKAHFETNSMWGAQFRDVITRLKVALKKAEPTIRKLATTTH